MYLDETVNFNLDLTTQTLHNANMCSPDMPRKRLILPRRGWEWGVSSSCSLWS